MIYFDKIGVIIDAKNSKEFGEYGRVIELKRGLNIISGDNTSGKTSLAKCFYFILGVEELINGKQNAIALDRCVYQQFICSDHGETNGSIQVEESYVIAQLSNDHGQVITAKRYIKKGEEKDFKNIQIWRCKNDDIKRDTPCTEYYTHYRGDHDGELPFGYFHFLAEFGGLSLINAPTKSGTDYTLYLSTLFALDFIEQTRGWTDYFATIRGYNFIQPKQRIIEYALGLGIDDIIVTYKTLKKENDEIKKEWYSKVKDIRQKLVYNNLCISELKLDITKQTKEQDELIICVIGLDNTLDIVLTKIENRIQELNSKLRRTRTDDERFECYNHQLDIFHSKENQYREFIIKFQDDKQKESDIQKQLVAINNEINRNRSIAQVSNYINCRHIRQCPTCHRDMDITDNGYLDIKEDDINRNIKYLSTQRKFLQGLLENLKEVISEKEIYASYYKRMLSIEKEKLNTAYVEVADNDEVPSESIIMELTELKLKKNNYTTVKEQIELLITKLWPLKNRFEVNKERLSRLKANKNDTENATLNIIQNKFKDLLFKFGYKSNDKSNVSLLLDEKDSNYLYLPQAVVDQYTEPLRSISSASDFVRSIWAYYLAMLENGSNHPGFLVFDEPCQHSINESSLKTFFKVCSETNKQIILFCSSELKTEETQEAEKQHNEDVKTNIEHMLKSIDPTSFNLIQMEIGEKFISKLK